MLIFSQSKQDKQLSYAQYWEKENDYILGDISTKGLVFDNIYLKKYKKTVDSEEFVQILNKDFGVYFLCSETKGHCW